MLHVLTVAQMFACRCGILLGSPHIVPTSWRIRKEDGGAEANRILILEAIPEKNIMFLTR